MKGELNKVVEDGRAATSVALYAPLISPSNGINLHCLYTMGGGYMHTTIGRQVGGDNAVAMT